MTAVDNKQNDSGIEVSDRECAEFEWMWKNSRKLDGSKLELKDAVSVPNAPVLLPRVITNVVREAAEPLLIGTSLLQRINYSAGTTITLGAVGAISAADIAEGQEYPEAQLNIGGGTVTATVGKSGLAVKFTEEMLRYSQFDVMSMHLRAAGRALARHKEVKIFNYIRSLGTSVFDNLNPTTSLKGVTTGRDLAGTGNGSLTMDDLFDCYAQILTHGFMPNAVLMHPLTWSMFVKDPVLRHFVLANGGGTFFATWTGNPAARISWDNQGGLGMGQGQLITSGPSGASLGASAGGTAASALSAYPQFLNAAPVLPNYWNVPLRIFVSPFVPYDPRTKLTDVYMFDANELGALIVDEDVTMDEWVDQRVDMRKIKFRERYAIAILNEGQAIGVMKNIHLVPNEIVLPAQATIDVSGSIAALSPTADVL